jgi:anti-anti-sigma regulatory factor
VETFTIQLAENRATMTICGDVTIQNISEFKESLLQMQDKADDLAIDLAGIRETDVACLQMICAAHRTWLQMNKRLSIAGPVPKGFRKILADSGYEREAGCRLYGNHPCLWARRAES